MNRALLVSTFAAAAFAMPLPGHAKPRPEGEGGSVVSPARVSGEVMVLLATQADGARAIDPAIGALPQLSKPPFNAYSHWKQVDRKTVTLERAKSTTVSFANGRTLQLTYSELAADKRYRVAAAVLREDGSPLQKVNVVAAAQEPFFLAGQKYQGGTLFIGITLKP